MRHWLFAGYALVCLACLVWPVYAQVGARIEPFVFGLPFAFVWVLGWLAATFVALLVYHWRCERAAPRREDP